MVSVCWQACINITNKNVICFCWPNVADVVPQSIGHVNIGVIFYCIGHPKWCIYSRNPIGCSTLSQEYCKLIGWFWKIVRKCLGVFISSLWQFEFNWNSKTTSTKRHRGRTLIYITQLCGIKFHSDHVVGIFLNKFIQTFCLHFRWCHW